MAFWYVRNRAQNKIENYKLGYLVDGGFDSQKSCALLTFLDPKTQETFIWRDVTGHLSYLYSNVPSEKAPDLFGSKLEGCIEENRYNAILDKTVTVTKVITKNPNDIGGDRPEAFKNILQSEGYQVWEAAIRYQNCYCYDRKLEYGMPYLVYNDRVVPYMSSTVRMRIDHILDIMKESGADMNDALSHFVRLFETEMPVISFTSADIEVKNTDNRVPDPKFPEEPVIAVSFVDSKGKKTVFLLRREDLVDMPVNIEGAEVRFFEREQTLIDSTFKLISRYPMVVTFNGDIFDLTYLVNRGLKLGLSKSTIPFYLFQYKNEVVYKKGVHLDIYHFFKNRSIQNYAFKAAYKRYGLDNISEALIKKTKIKLEKPIGYLTYDELARYCLNDSVLTTELMTFNSNVVLNLIIAICRMANLTMTQVCRAKISVWTRSTFYYFHRMRNILIPNQEELTGKGAVQTEATIHGKKYRGAIVKDISAGARFNVVVSDFASLYPSEVKFKNICYSTINCPHEECKTNLVPDTTHHICTIRRGIMPEIIGGLRDARVYYYKDQAKTNPDPMLKAFYSVFEQAIKVYINASYGVFGSEEFALYCPPVAESITAYARADMTAVVDHAIAMGIDVFYGDTDSVFMNNPTIEQTTELQNWTKTTLKLDLGIDKVYRVGFFSERKKNYLGVYKDGTLDIKGMSGKKSHIPDMIKKPFNETQKIISGINKLEDIPEAKKKIIEITKTTHENLKAGNFELKDLAFRVTMQRDLESYANNAQHVKAARAMEEKGIHVTAGDEIIYVKAKTESKVMPVEGGDKKLVDIKTYISQLRSVMEQIFDAMDIGYEFDIEGIPKPTKLADYFPKTTKKKEKAAITL